MEHFDQARDGQQLESGKESIQRRPRYRGGRVLGRMEVDVSMLLQKGAALGCLALEHFYGASVVRRSKMQGKISGPEELCVACHLLAYGWKIEQIQRFCLEIFRTCEGQLWRVSHGLICVPGLYRTSSILNDSISGAGLT